MNNPLRSLLHRSLRGLVACVLAATPAFAAEGPSPKSVLIVTVTKGFRHSSIPTAEKVLAELAQSSRAFTVDYVRNDEDMALKMTPEKLKRYDGFIFANTTGILPLPDKDAFLNEIKGGKGFVGMHSASDTFHGKGDTVDPYIEMVGGEFLTHGAQVGVECLVQDTKHPATKHLGESWCIEQEEIYLFKNYNRPAVHELLVLDKHPNKKKESGHFPVAWNKTYGQGRVFYTSLGHREDVWESDRYKKHILGGIKWALGLEPGDATPQAK
ncbi:MAG TPA: ThuA domain-containing protein [Methylomirabilota bacterium]|nr:ThuA domain-containing protein [Methylomirabilota bacterium]